MIRQLPEREVPAGMAQRIMGEVSAEDRRLSRRMVRWLTGSFPIRVQPLWLAGAASVLALVFWLGLTVGSHTSVVEHPNTDTPGTLIFQTTDAQASFLIGRGLLAAGFWEESIPYLQQASLLGPENPEYVLWEGVALGKTGDRVGEGNRYRRALDLHPEYVPARLYLAHVLLESGQADAALAEYSHVLELAPDDETALYNRALAYQLLGENNRAADAWKEYLDTYRSGVRAFRAVLHLNELGDFTYRSYQIGFRKAILNQELLLGVDGAGRQEEIILLADLFSKSTGSILEIVVFQDKDTQQAGTQARLLKHQISDHLSVEEGKSVNISWFGQPERLRTPTGKQFLLQEGLLVFSKPREYANKENRI